MSLITPILQPISPFDATKDYIINFNVGQGGNQITQNTITIYNNSDNTQIYTNTIQSFLLQHTIPANILTNRTTQYKIVCQTGDINNNWSNYSDSVVFNCLAPPIYTFTNIDVSGKVYNQNVTFSCTYTQAQSELLSSYIYNLYDYNQNLIQSYPNVFTSVSPLTQLISGLANATLYYVQVKTISVNGQLGDSGLIPFTPFYISPSLFSTLTTTPIPSTGSISVSAIVIQETGKMDTGTAIYENSTWIDLTQGGQVSFQNGFTINSSSFVAKIWCKNVISTNVFARLFSPDGKIELHMEDNQVHAYVYLTGSSVSNHYISNALVYTTSYDASLSLDTNTSFSPTLIFDTSSDTSIFLDTLFGINTAGQGFMVYVKCQYNSLDLFLSLA